MSTSPLVVPLNDIKQAYRRGARSPLFAQRPVATNYTVETAFTCFSVICGTTRPSRSYTIVGITKAFTPSDLPLAVHARLLGECDDAVVVLTPFQYTDFQRY